MSQNLIEDFHWQHEAAMNALDKIAAVHMNALDKIAAVQSSGIIGIAYELKLAIGAVSMMRRTFEEFQKFHGAQLQEIADRISEAAGDVSEIAIMCECEKRMGELVKEASEKVQEVNHATKTE